MSSSVEIRDKAMSIATGMSSGLDSFDPRRNFDRMQHVGLLSYMRKEDLVLLYELATNAKYSMSSIKDKISVFDQIICPRGFKRTHSGTNRIVYSHFSDETFILKVALDKTGVIANKYEFYNQEVLKPFVPKVFDISDNGVVILMEKVLPILNREQFVLNAKSIFNLIVYLVGCGYIMEDVGTDFFMNWGIRNGFGPVLLDFPYVYRVNKSRLHCIQRTSTGEKCKGEIEYDDGFNFLVCNKCGKRYAAKDIGSNFKYLNEIKYKIKKGETMMGKVIIKVKSNAGKYEVACGKGTNMVPQETAKNIIKSFDDAEKKVVKAPTAPIQKTVQKPAQTNLQDDAKFTRSNNLMIETLLKEFGFNTKDVSEEFKQGLIKMMMNSTSTYIKINHRVVPTDQLKAMNDDEKESFEENIKNSLNSKRLRIVENDLVTDYYAPTVYYDNKILKECIRTYINHYNEYVLNKNKKEAEAAAKATQEEKKPVEEAPKADAKLEMAFPNANTLGNPVISQENAVDETAKQATAIDNF